MTDVGDLASSCDGTIGPDGCSGLAIISKFPFVEVRLQILLLSLLYFNIIDKVSWLL